MIIREATPEDNQPLQALQARCPMGTSLVVSTVNTPDFFSRAKAYEWHRVYVAAENDEIIGSAACATRDALVNGQAVRIGYAFQYFTSPDHRHQGVATRLHRRIEQALQEQGAALVYLVMIEGNTPAMALFEEMGFAQLSTFTMPSLVVYREMDIDLAGGTIRPARAGDLERIAELTNATWQEAQLTEPMSAEGLARFIERTPALDLHDFLVLEKDGQLLACAGCWDWSQITRLTVISLAWKMKLINLGLDLVGLFRPMPDSIRAGDTLEQLALTKVGFRHPRHLPTLLTHINNVCLERDLGQIFLVCEPRHPLLDHLDGFIHIDTGVHLYAKTLQPGLEIGPGPVYLDGVDM
jgi:N-acetylglutamate synthase-like GNAT family acetyltransferase